MRLGVDVDGVVLDSGALYNAVFHKKFTLIPENKDSWDFEEAYGISTEEVNKVLREVEQITDVSLIPGAQILNKSVELPHIESPIHFVSSRSQGSFYPTVEALQHHFDFPIFLRCDVNKGIYCDKYELDFFVEDEPPHIKDIYKNAATKIYILDKPYNRNILCFENLKGSNVLRIKNWDEILIDLQREVYREAVRVKNGGIDG